MKKKIIIRIAAGLAAVFLVLFIILCNHLYGIEKRIDENPTNQLQLSRIDFKQQVDSAEAMKIKNYVTTLQGVQGAYFNLAHRTLVYGYIIGTQTPSEVYNKIMDFSGHKYKADRFVISAAQLQRGCPAGMNTSYAKNFSKFIYKTFK